MSAARSGSHDTDAQRDAARLEAIEIKIAHLEATVAQLSDELVLQQRELEAVRTRNARLSDQIAALEQPAVSATAIEKPPHY